MKAWFVKRPSADDPPLFLLTFLDVHGFRAQHLIDDQITRIPLLMVDGAKSVVPPSAHPLEIV